MAIAILLWAAPAGLLARYDIGWLINTLATGVLRHWPAVLVALPAAIAYMTASAAYLVWASRRMIAAVALSGLRAGLVAIVSIAVALSLMAATLLATAFFFDLILWCFPTLI